MPTIFAPAFVSGKQEYLSFTIGHCKNDLDLQCRGNDRGLKVTISTPGEALHISQNTFRIPLSYIGIFRIIPELTTTTEKLRVFKPHQRKYFFDNERQLRFFKVYAQANCEVKCMANFTKQECECVRFSIPSIYAIFTLNK